MNFLMRLKENAKAAKAKAINECRRLYLEKVIAELLITDRTTVNPGNLARKINAWFDHNTWWQLKIIESIKSDKPLWPTDKYELLCDILKKKIEKFSYTDLNTLPKNDNINPFLIFCEYKELLKNVKIINKQKHNVYEKIEALRIKHPEYQQYKKFLEVNKVDIFGIPNAGVKKLLARRYNISETTVRDKITRAQNFIKNCMKNGINPLD